MLESWSFAGNGIPKLELGNEKEELGNEKGSGEREANLPGSER